MPVKGKPAIQGSPPAAKSKSRGPRSVHVRTLIGLDCSPQSPFAKVQKRMTVCGEYCQACTRAARLGCARATRHLAKMDKVARQPQSWQTQLHFAEWQKRGACPIVMADAVAITPCSCSQRHDHGIPHAGRVLHGPVFAFWLAILMV